MYEVIIELKRIGVFTSIALEQSELDRLISDWRKNETKHVGYEGWDVDTPESRCSPYFAPSHIKTLTINGELVTREKAIEGWP